jgi:nicotinate phosphoribosyltransferase
VRGDLPAAGLFDPIAPSGSAALLTDHYELTMLEAALAHGTAGRRCVFEVFARRLPPGRRYGVVAGVGRVLDAIEAFRFTDDQIAFLLSSGVVSDPTARWLADYRFTGDVVGYAEGDCFFPYSPIMTVEGSFAEAVLLETVVLSILNHDCAVAGAASRMTRAAGERPCVEMGSRRTHEAAAVAAARAAYVAGFASTSNLAAGHRYGIPTRGTAAHAFTLLHDSELEAFEAQVTALGAGTTLLVDTYEVDAAVVTAVQVAGPELGGVRLDSGDLVALAHRVRDRLDSLGARGTRIIVTSDLDEYAIAALAAAPVDAYGVGTQLVTGSGAPTANLVYKLVARQHDDGGWQSVQKHSTGKGGAGGRKQAVRRRQAGVAVAELVAVGAPPVSTDGDRSLQVDLVRSGEVVGREPLRQARERHERACAELPEHAHKMSQGDAAIPTLVQGALEGGDR